MEHSALVSVICITYNHEKYIRHALEGFVSQKTNFRYKVIIHEDASTDETAKIIRSFEEKYPEIFDVIYQKENQYSKRVNIFEKFILPRIEGNYIAFCEGDDYWCDENKLQKQFDLLEANPDALCAFHRVGLITEAGDPIKGTYPARKQKSCFLTSQQFVDYVCCDFFQVSSMFCRSAVYLAYMDNIPRYAMAADVGDIPLFLYLGTRSEQVGFLDETMSRYRCASAGSATLAMAKTAERQRLHWQRMMYMIDAFDEDTAGRFHRECELYRERETFETYAKLKDINNIMKKSAYRRRFVKLPLRAQASIAVKGSLMAVKNKVRNK